MSKKKSRSTVSDASDAREADSVVTAEDLVETPEPEVIGVDMGADPVRDDLALCNYCTAEIGPDGICENCGKPFAA